jgi:hypothetical protein
MYRILLSWRQEWRSFWRKILLGLLAGLVVGSLWNWDPFFTPLASFAGAATPSLPYLRYWWQPAWVMALGIVLISWVTGFHWMYVPLEAMCGAFLPYAEWWRVLRRFRVHTRNFEKRSRPLVVIRWPKELTSMVNVDELLQSSEAAITEFSQKFRFRLKRRVVVYVFARYADIQQVFGSPAGGFALTGGEAMVLAPDTVGTLKEVLRHELTHLFSRYWSQAQLPFNHEGLATCLMETVEGQPIDYHALLHILADSYFPMVMRVPSQFFRQARNSNFYIAAGSFTGFLIRTFGWEAYEKFFRRADENNYEKVFAKDFGMGILAAERRWRFQLLQGRKALEPELSQAVAEFRVEAAYNCWQFYRCLDEIERLARNGPLSAKCLWFAAAAHVILGHYADAVPLEKQLLEMNDPWVTKHRSRLWTGLGNLYDLLGHRADALKAYEKVLTEPDSWLPNEGSTHQLARGYMQQSYTEAHLLKRYKYWIR